MGTIPETRTESAEAAAPFDGEVAWRGGAIAGFFATVVMGLVITATDLTVLRSAIAGLYGFEGSLLAGWVAHLVHGTLFGVVFAFVLADPGLYGVERWVWKTTLAGVVYALGLAVVATGFVMPVWLGLAGVGTVPEMPFVTTATVAWHVVYGLVLGAVYPYAVDLAEPQAA